MDVMDEALDLLGDAGPEYGPRFSNHATDADYRRFKVKCKRSKEQTKLTFPSGGTHETQ
jgi:hypothetical protein